MFDDNHPLDFKDVRMSSKWNFAVPASADVLWQTCTYLDTANDIVGLAIW